MRGDRGSSLFAPLNSPAINKALTPIASPACSVFPAVSWPPLFTFCWHQKSPILWLCCHCLIAVVTLHVKCQVSNHPEVNTTFLKITMTICCCFLKAGVCFALCRYKPRATLWKYTESFSFHSTSSTTPKLQGQQFTFPG